MPARLTKTRQKFTLFKFDHAEHQLSKEILIKEDDIFCQPLHSGEQRSFFGVLTRVQLESLLKQIGVLSGLKKRGFENVVIEVNTKDPFEHSFQICCTRAESRFLLIEAILHRTAVDLGQLAKTLKSTEKVDVLFVEWLLLQNPICDFDEHRPQLPGQRRPGLGLASEVLKVLVEVCKRCGLGGLVAVPGHYHNAVIFSTSFKYLNAECEGKLRSLQRDLAGYPLSMTSWAIELNCVRDADSGEYLSWFVDWQVFGTGDRLKEYFASHNYSEKVSTTHRQQRYVLDEAKFNVEKEKIGQMADVII